MRRGRDKREDEREMTTIKKKQVKKNGGLTGHNKVPIKIFPNIEFKV